MPSFQTIKNYAYWLANFLEWAELRGVDPTTCDYSAHILGRYQADMLDGVWSRDGVGLSPNTINLRIQLACDFVSWLAAKGYRSAFVVPSEIVTRRDGSATSSIGHLVRDVPVRVGKVRTKKRSLRMPTNDEVRAWLGRVDERFGETKGLMCEIILLTGLRREEVSCLRVDTIPEDRQEWRVNNPEAPYLDQQVRVTIKFGSKGPSYGYDHGDKIGPEREIWVPLHLVERLQDYRKRLRNPALRRWIKSAPSPTAQKHRINETVHLFLDEQTGNRITSRDLYRAWTGVLLPFKGWSPHLGRDWWACSTLWSEMKKHEALLALGMDAPLALLESSAVSAVRFVIQPQLGHSHESTTMIYLQWFLDMRGGGLAIRYDEDHENSTREAAP